MDETTELKITVANQLLVINRLNSQARNSLVRVGESWVHPVCGKTYVFSEESPTEPHCECFNA